MAKYFSDEEIKGLDPELVIKLDQIRSLIGRPIIITSGKRTEEENKKVNGKNNSAHLAGFAVDIRTPDSNYRYELIKAAYQVGITRIEPAPLHTHIDISTVLPQNVMFLGGSN